MPRSLNILAAVLLSVACVRSAEPDWKQVLERLERLEQENAQLKDEVRRLKERLDGEGPPIEERVAVQERRVEEQQQTKVESSERVPVKLTGMLLFNAFSSGNNGLPPELPALVGGRPGLRQIRGTMRQTSIGLRVESPGTILGARARGEVMTDFYGDYDGYPTPRIRTGFLDLDWKTTSFRAGIDKPIVAPRNPSSLAQVVYPALWGIGNLWFWQPQARFEQRFQASGNEIRAQFGLYQTLEETNFGTLAPRPGWQTRIQFARNFRGERRFELAPGFHYSRTLVAGTSVPSQLITGDWLFQPARFLEFTGAFFHGRNAGPIGGLRQGIIMTEWGTPRAVATTGGWGQVMLKPIERLRIHAMFGEQDDRNRDLMPGGIARNLSWIVNGMVQLSPNVLIGLEMQQIRTSIVQSPNTRVLNRYDLALAYLF